MLNGKGISNKFWGEVVSTIIYILNISFAKSLDGKTPYEVWIGMKLRFNHMRVFGSLIHEKTL